MSTVDAAIIEYIVNNKGEGSSDSGSTKEIIAPLDNYTTSMNNEGFYFTELAKPDLFTGLRLRLYNNSIPRTEEYMLVITNYDFLNEGDEDATTSPKGMFFSMESEKYGNISNVVMHIKFRCWSNYWIYRPSNSSRN